MKQWNTIIHFSVLKQTVGSSVEDVLKLNELKASWLDGGLWQQDSWAITWLWTEGYQHGWTSLRKNSAFPLSWLTLYFRVVLGLQRNLTESAEISIYLLHWHFNFLYHKRLVLLWYFCHHWWMMHWCIINSSP